MNAESEERTGTAPAVTDARSFAFEHLAAVAAVIDNEGTIVDTNAAWRLFASLNGGTIATTGPGTNYVKLCERAGADGDAVAGSIARGLRRVLSGETTHFEFEYPCPTATEDRWFLLQASSAPVTTGGGAIVFHVDITTEKARRDRLSFEAYHDELTGLPNRRALTRRLENLRREHAVGPNPSWLFLFDLDGFKRVNDDHGHQIGDDLLGLVAARAQRIVRDGDMVARLGGDEFVLLCENLPEEGALVLAERLRVSLAQPFQIRSLEVALGASIGLIQVDRSLTPAELLDVVDRRMYDDKRRRYENETSPPTTAPPLPIAPSSSADAERHFEPTAANTRGSEAKRVIASAMTDAVVANSNDLVMFFAQDGTIEWVSRASQRVFGVAPEALVGLNGFDMIHPSDRDRVIGDFMSIPNLEDRVRTEFRIVTPDGRVGWVDEIATNLLEDPNVGMIVGNLRDITDRKQAEDAVRFQARLLDAVRQAVVAIDQPGAIIYWNEAATALYGYRRDEALGRSLTELLPAAEGWESISDQIQDRLRRGLPWDGEIRIVGKDGREIPLLVSDTPVFDDDGGHVATIGVGTDITERIRSEEITARLSAIVESSGDAVVSADLNGAVDTWNHRARELFDPSSRDFNGRQLVDLFDSENRAVVEATIGQVADGGPVTGLELRTDGPDGDSIELGVTFSPIRRSVDHTTIGISVIARDITERLRLHRGIDQERRRLADAQRCARLGSFELDLDTGRSTRSEELCRILGLPVESSGSIDLEWVHPDDREECATAMRRIVDGEVDVEMTHRIVRPDGEVRWVVSRTSDLSRGRIICGTVLDITEQRVAQLTLEHQASHDPLTGLENRVGLARSVGQLLARTRPQGQSVAVAMLDLDQFNQINDTLGHTVGDEVLKAVSSRFEQGLPSTDIVARFGGDEFVVIRTDVATSEEAEALGADIQRTLDDEILLGHRRFHVSCCVGVAISTADTDVDSLLSHADAAVHLAKQCGRSEIAVFDPASRAAANRLHNLESALARAIDNDELRVEYQPVIDLGDGTAAGFEALLRWTSDAFGDVSPAEFIPIAEASGLIVRIGRWVLDRALAQLASWRAVDTACDVWLSVNVSARQLDRPEFVDTVLDLMRSHGVPFRNLHLEVTESAALHETETSSDTLVRLRNHGIKVSIDDFGTGYSSLSYLDRLPIDVIKIDRAFVRELHVSAERTAIVRTIVALASTLDLDIVAEGVENDYQARFLRKLGCRHGQGFLWSPSLPGDEAAAWIGTRAALPPTQ
ncbi:MAG: EAL domain-containing protein [Acidimicrobiales bacterium]